jgi:hypothetical protein
VLDQIAATAAEGPVTPTTNAASPDTINTATAAAAAAGMQFTLKVFTSVDYTVLPGTYQAQLTFTLTCS